MGGQTEQAERVSGEVIGGDVPPPGSAELVAPVRSAARVGDDSIKAALSGTKRERRSVARFLNLAEDDPALDGVMALSKAYGLSPFLGELFVIDQKVRFRDAEGHQVERYQKKAAAGRDGFLSVAHKSGVHRGVQADVVCALDTFAVDWTGTPENPVHPEDAPRVTHRHAPMRPGGSVADALAYRGPIIGAWAKVYRTDQVPFFYLADLREHGRRWTKDGRSGWAGAWEYTRAMIVKAAMSYGLRMAYSITGVVPADELKVLPRADVEGSAVDIEQVMEVADTIPEGIPDELRERLIAAVNECNALDPTAWPAAKCDITFGGRSGPELEVLLRGIDREVEARRAAAARREAAQQGEPERPGEPAGQGAASVFEQDTPEALRAALADAEARATAALNDAEERSAREESDELRRKLDELGEPHREP